jgi:glutathione S-transferase
MLARARLYSMAISHPGNAARLMLEHKGIAFDLVDILPGLQAGWVRAAGFGRGTVPALRLGDRRIVGSRAISRALDEVQPDPPLFPRDPEHRRAVEEAETWGEQILQPLPRRLVRWGIRNDHAARIAFTGIVGMPLPTLAAWAMLPAGAFYARREDAGSRDRIAAGVLGGEQLNAADFQIGTTVRVMLGCADYAPLIEGRPAAALARRVWPEYRTTVPTLLPPELRPSSSP